MSVCSTTTESIDNGSMVKAMCTADDLGGSGSGQDKRTQESRTVRRTRRIVARSNWQDRKLGWESASTRESKMMSEPS